MLTAHATATSGDAGLLATLDKPRASTSLATHSCPFRQPHDHEARTNLKPPPSSPADDPQTPSASLPAPTTSASGMTTEARTNLGPPATSSTHTPQTAHRLVTRSGCGDNLPPRRPDTPRAAAIFTSRRSRGSLPTSIIFRPRRQPATPASSPTSGCRHFHQQTDFGRTGPNLSTTDGPHSDAVTAAIAASFGKSGVRSPTRRTSPVMTNKRVKSVLEPARNAAVMAPPSPAPCPADHPAAPPQSLPLHPDSLFDPAPNAKTRRACKALRASVRVHFSR